jgi:hypothetical protein
MGVIRLESFDAWDSTENAQRYEDGGGIGSGVVLEAAAAKTGTQGLHFNNATQSIGNYALTIHGNNIWDDGTNENRPEEVGVGFWVKYSGTFNSDTAQPLLKLGTVGTPIKFYYLTAESGGSIKLWQTTASVSWGNAAITAIGTYSADVDSNTISINDGNWHHIELYAGHPDDNSNDIFELRVNGVRVAIDDTSTLDTSPSTTAWICDFTRQEQGIYIDSIYQFEVSSTSTERFLGPVDISALLPGSQGVNEEWAGDTAEPNSFDDINDALAETRNDTGKVQSNTTSQVRHDWNYVDVSTNALRWKVLQACPMARTGSGVSGNVRSYIIADGSAAKATPTVYLTIPSSPVLSDSTTYPLSNFTNYSWLRFIGTPDDHPDIDDTIVALNKMAFGVENVSGDDASLRITHYPIEVAIPSDPVARMSQSVVEYALVSPAAATSPEARMSQSVVEYAIRTTLPEPQPGNQAHRALFIECMAHSNTDDGFSGGGADYWRCVAEGNGGRGFVDPHNMVHCVAHGNTSHGIEITHGQPATLMYCCSVLNQGAGLQLTEVASSKVPFVLLIKYSAYNNTDGRIAQGGATPATSTYLDEDAVTLSGDPFTDATIQDFSLNSDYGTPLKNLLGDKFFKFPQTVSYHDHQAIQRICPTVDDDELNQFTDTQSNRNVN